MDTEVAKLTPVFPYHNRPRARRLRVGRPRTQRRTRLGRSTGLVAAATAVLLSAGCDSNTSDRQAERRVRIVVVGEVEDDPTSEVLRATARWFAAQEPFAEVEVRAPQARSPRLQRALLEGLATRDVDAVCVIPTDPEAIRPAIHQLAQKGISVVTMGRDVPGSGRGATCGPSGGEIGRAAVEACTAAVKGRSKTVMLLHAGPENPVDGDRYVGFMRAFRLHPALILLREINCGGRGPDAVRRVRLEARKYPRAGCWVFLEDWPFRATPPADRLLPPGHGVVLCNGSPRYFGRLREGRIVAVVTYDLRRVVEEALSKAYRLAESGAGLVAPRYTAAVEIITVEDLVRYEDRWKAWKQPIDYRPSAFRSGPGD